MPLSDIYQITALGSYRNSASNNVWHVEKLDAGSVSADINTAFVDSLTVDQLALQAPPFEMEELQTFNLGTPTDFATLGLTGKIGTRAGAAAAELLAFAFRFPTLNRDIRSGRKRFGGVADEISTGGDIAAAFITDMNTFGASIIADWEKASAPGTSVCRYIVVKRIKVVNPVTGAISYRLPETDSELLFYAPTSSISDNTMRSQNSRKVL